MKYHKPERIPRLGSLLVFVLVMFCLLAFASFHAMAEGPVYSGTTKTVDCDNPVTRTDGTALDPGEIASVEIYIRTSPTGSPEHTIIMPGGCQPMTLDLTTLSEGQKHMDGICTDLDGRASVLSAPQVPFVYQRANPTPPSGLVITD